MQQSNNVMMKYIKETPDKLTQILQSKQIDKFLEKVKIKKINNIMIVGSGSSYNAGVISQKIFEKYTEIKTDVLYPSNVNITNIELYSPDSTLIIGISQTGTSSSTIDAVRIFKEKGFKILILTNELASPLAELGNDCLDLLVGKEESNAKTKGFMATILNLQLLAMKMAYQYNRQARSIYKQFIEEVEDSIDEIPHTIQQAKDWINQNISKELLQPSLVIGTEEYLGVTMEGATKLLETTGSLSGFIDYSEFAHGMHRTVDKQENLYIIVSNNKRKSITQSINYLGKKANSLCVLNIVETKLNYNDGYFINIRERPITDSVYNLVIAFQVFASLIPYLNDLDPNRNLNDDYAELVSTRQN